ncbi:formylglycine-generating enzyme family protein [candidate division KSB1 bacterium]|nr:formylglycine-generating enzyme family protein [candidate division KSB1 bacterium]
MTVALSLGVWKVLDWTVSSPQKPPATKQIDDSSATKRQSSIQPLSEQLIDKKQGNTSTETKRGNKPTTPLTTPESRVRTTLPGMRFIRGGAFLMGSSENDTEAFKDERPRHLVIVDDFYLDEHEVTVVDYQSFLNATNYREPEYWNEQKSNPYHPVVNVNWNDAQAYAKWAGKRLPTETEWEYAARGGNTGLDGTPHYKFPWGDEASHERANYSGIEGRDRWRGTSPVKSFPANGFGLYDMAGNFWEWCEDWYDENYYKSRPNADRNPKGPSTGEYRVLRGGSRGNAPQDVRCANRNKGAPTHWNGDVGIRCAQDALF